MADPLFLSTGPWECCHLCLPVGQIKVPRGAKVTEQKRVLCGALQEGRPAREVD